MLTYQDYLMFNKSDKFIVGFIYQHYVYYIILDTIEEYIKFDTASRNQGQSLRLRLYKKQKIDLLSRAHKLCSEAEFKKIKENSKYNRGEIFENLVFIVYSQNWKKDNRPFYECGDIRVNGVEYQIKFERATLTTEKQITRLKAKV